MSALSIQPTFPIFTDIDGQPLEDGYVWIGTANLDPQTNPISVFFDAALTISAAQPIRTLSGYPANAGTPARLYVNSDYSIRVMNKNGSVVYSAPAATERYSGGVISTINASQVVYDPAGLGSVATTVQAKLRESVSVLDFGADPTGATDTTATINTALSSGAKLVRFPAGTYRIDATVVVPKDVSIVGDGAGATIFDGSQAVDANIINNAHIVSEEATYVALPTLALNANKNARTLTFVSAPNVQAGDVVCIYNPTNFSWLGTRDYYRAGEYIRVASVTGNVVELQGTLCDSYLTTAVTVYRVDDMTTCHWKGFTVIGKPNSSKPLSGVELLSAKDSSLEDIRVVRATYIGISVYLCFNVQVRQCTAEEDFAPGFGGEYGLAISNSHIVNVSGGYFYSRRHGLTIGGGSGIGRVPNRYLTIIGATIGSTGGSNAADIHGNAEYVIYSNCIVDGGFSGFGGDYQTINNCQIRGEPTEGPSGIYFSELKGFNFKIINNTITTSQAQDTGRGMLIDLGGNSIPFGAFTTRGGIMLVSNNTMLWQATGDTGLIGPMVFNNRGYVGAENISLHITNNKIVASTSSNTSRNSIQVFGAGTVPFSTVEFSGNDCQRSSGVRLNISSSAENTANVAIAHNNTIKNGLRGILFENVTDIIDIQGNTVRDVELNGIRAIGRNPTFKCKQVTVSNNTVIENSRSTTASTFTDAPLVCWYAERAFIDGNLGGSFNEQIFLTSTTGFQVGETITGGSSGATAVIYNVRSATQLDILQSRVGTFSAGETVTGSVSGATTTVAVAGVKFTEAHTLSIGDLSNFYLGQNTFINTTPTVNRFGTIDEISTFIPFPYTTTARNALPSPRTGVIIYNTTTNKLNFYNGTAWEAVTST